MGWAADISRGEGSGAPSRGYVVAAGWFAYGVWDFVHLALRRVVVRSYAEWCEVVDILVAVQLVVLP